jgi:hypothetical protein
MLVLRAVEKLDLMSRQKSHKWSRNCIIYSFKSALLAVKLTQDGCISKLESFIVIYTHIEYSGQKVRLQNILDFRFLIAGLVHL